MKLFINGCGGIAGDMFTSALISAGADWPKTRSAMLTAATKLGPCSIAKNLTSDNSTQLQITLNSAQKHLSEKEAKKIINDSLEELNITKTYREFGNLVLSILLQTEKEAHRKFNIIVPGDDKGHQHHHHHDQAVLHEAQDIVIDIVGAAFALMDLGSEPQATLLGPVSTGGGEISFSHGRFKVPAPATQLLLDKYRIKYQQGPIEKELCTPTGAAILAALGTGGDIAATETVNNPVSSGRSRGSSILPIKPLCIYLV